MVADCFGLFELLVHVVDDARFRNIGFAVQRVVLGVVDEVVPKE